MIGAIDIGGTKIALGVMTESGELLCSTTIATQPNLPYLRHIEQLQQALNELLLLQPATLQGIGIGITGQLTAAGSLQPNAFLPHWSGMNPAADLAGSFGVSAALENDADAAALAEQRWGAGQHARRSIYVTVGTGIGGGIVLDGALYRGAGRKHPEIGHHVIDPQGPACFCGAHGCWERFASGSALAAWAHSHGGDPTWTAEAICALAEQHHPLAQRAVERTGEYLGLGLANLITLFAPDCIILGGGLMQRWRLFEPYVRAVVMRQCRLVSSHDVQLVPAQLAHPGLLGAGAVWLHSREGSVKCEV